MDIKKLAEKLDLDRKNLEGKYQSLIDIAYKWDNKLSILIPYDVDKDEKCNDPLYSLLGKGKVIMSHVHCESNINENCMDLSFWYIYKYKELYLYVDGMPSFDITSQDYQDFTGFKNTLTQIKICKKSKFVKEVFPEFLLTLPLKVGIETMKNLGIDQEIFTCYVNGIWEMANKK